MFQYLALRTITVLLFVQHDSHIFAASFIRNSVYAGGWRAFHYFAWFSAQLFWKIIHTRTNYTINSTDLCSFIHTIKASAAAAASERAVSILLVGFISHCKANIRAASPFGSGKLKENAWHPTRIRGPRGRSVEVDPRATATLLWNAECTYTVKCPAV